MTSASLDARIEHWQQNLLDLTLRNRLLNFKPKGSVHLLRPDPGTVLDRLVRDEATLTIREAPSGDEVGKVELGKMDVLAAFDPTGLDGVLRKLRLRARGAVQEQGANILFLAVGIVRWFETESSEDELLAPLLLVPVELLKEGPLAPFRLRAIDEEVVVNPTLAYKLSADYRLTLPEWDEDAGTLADYLAEARRSVAPLTKWSMEETAYLGLFSFAKLSMYKEMSAYRPLLAQHPLVNALAGDRSLLPAIPDYPRADRLDDTVRPINTFQILDADSSQQEAIEMAKRGITFVLQGPPGTGKSQTIANIIAESLAGGKRVLFVSEKMAALEVVKRRLDEKGLGDFILELHNHRADKAEVIEELRRSAQPLPTEQAQMGDLDRLEKLRFSLDDYVQALHQIREPLRVSAYQVHGALASLHDAASLPVAVPDAATMRPEDLDDRLRVVKRVEVLQGVLARTDDHPWRDLVLDGWKPGNDVMVEATLRELGERVEKVKAIGHEMATLAGRDDPRSLAEAMRLSSMLRRAASTPFPMEAWLSSGQPDALISRAEQCREYYTMRRNQAAWMTERYSDDVLAIDTTAMLDRFRKEYSGFFRFLKKGYKADMAELRSFAKDGRERSYATALAELRQIDKIRRDAQRAGEMESSASHDFGERFKGDRTDWDELNASLMWAAHFMSDFGGMLSKQVVALVVDPKGRSSALPGPVREADAENLKLLNVLERLQKQFVLPDSPGLQAATLDSYEDLAIRHLADLALLREWVEVKELEGTCQETGLGEVFALAKRKGLPEGDLAGPYRKRVFQAWRDLIYSQDRRLGGFRSVEREEAIAQFRALDEGQMAIARKRLRERLAASRNALLDVEAGRGSELAALRHELGKKRRFKQLRQLFRECPHVLQGLKPCLLMSPLSVSQYLDPVQVRFDLVIFDEASQVRPEDAIGSIMRGAQVIVVGDSKQLPPTSFFRAGTDEDEETEEDLESILDECTALDIKQHMLLWHYRSRDEALIAFSNRHIYDRRLFTFPSASTGHGVSLIHVPSGVYDRGGSRTNIVEAKRVAELAFEHFARRPDQSLGVVAFSEAQQLAILDQLDRLRRERPEFERFFAEGSSEEFFVKNLENVQGDERDVMIFSVGYGKDDKGKMYQNFGPLNKPGGERRMNVAITRAKRQVIVVSSILADDVDGSGGAGPRLLKEYLRYAASGGDRGVLEGGRNGAEDGYLLEDEVFEALTAEGLKVQRRVGCSGYRIDLAVEDPERPGTYLLGIECDGAAYRSGKTARDRDRLRPLVLLNLGWRVHRIWSRDWVDDRDGEVLKVKRALGLVSGLAPTAAVPPKEPAPPKVTRTVRAGGPVDLVAALNSIVNVNGPVHESEAKRSLEELTPDPRDIDLLYNASVKALTAEGKIAVREGFLWPAGMGQAPLRKPAGPRDLDMVSLEELGEAVLFSFRSDPQVRRASLVNRTALYYRNESPTERSRARIGQAIDRLIASERLKDVGDEVLRRMDRPAE